ncbi:hypothetical protein OUZ56_012488 [Daphnia magna]|uniref:Uncharacterized protein n=1 Tax=Daphnia magna TaxID=35525 RepID=A0ABQ9Z374_9CRUS|nr:hypothetical protein OUZ56_012488 [Daphnia magna]
MRVTVTNTIQLVEFLLGGCNYDYVLTGKFFGIVRSCRDGQEAPVASSFLRIYPMLSIYVPVRNALRVDENCDDNERMHVLTSYKDCMLQSYRENVKQGEDNRKSLKDELLKGLMYSNECQKKAPNKDLDIIHSNATYYLCGYLVHSRAERINCNICLASLSTEENQLPSDF